MTKIGSAEDRARAIIDEAVKAAEDKEARGFAGSQGRVHQVQRTRLDKEIKERRSEIQRNERRVVQKEEQSGQETGID